MLITLAEIAVIAEAQEWQKTIQSFAVTYGLQILGALVILICGWMIGRSVGRFLNEWMEKKHLEPPLRMLCVRVVRVLILAMTLVVTLDKLGVNVMPMIAGLGVAGVGVGFAMQGVLGNLFAGLTIIFTKPFRVGEYIEVLGQYGQVSVIELFTTTLVHADESRIIIPNRKIVGEILHNYGTLRQQTWSVSVAYGTNIKDACDTILNVVKSNPRILATPGPGVGVGELGESGITIGIAAWTQVGDFGPVKGEVYKAITEALAQKQIAIPYPRRDLHIVERIGPASAAS